MTQKLYCYVDESGQDTEGELFIVAVVVATEERERLRKICTDIEANSRKGIRKWSKSNGDRRLAYIRDVLGHAELRGRLCFATYHSTQDYLSVTVRTITLAMNRSANGEYKATVLIDGLSRSDERNVGLMLRRSGLSVQKVRGINDESEPLIRLADALCGFVRSVMEGNSTTHVLLTEALHTGVIVDLNSQ